MNVYLFLMLIGIISYVFWYGLHLYSSIKDTEHPIVVVFYFPLVATPIMGVLTYFQWVQPIGSGG